MDNFSKLSVSQIKGLFHKIYYGEIVPRMLEQEKIRKSKLVLLFLIELISLGIIFAIYKIDVHKLGNPLFMYLYFIAGLLIFCSLFVVPYLMNKKFVKNLKKDCMYEVLKSFGNIKWANPETLSIGNGVNSDNDIVSSELFAYYNKRYNDDMFWGTFNGTEFAISETSLVQDTGSGKSRRIEIVFKGVIIKFKSNKNIKNKTIIATKNDTNIKNNFVTVTTFCLTILVAIGAFLVRDISLIIFSSLSVILLLILLLKDKFVKNKEVLNEIHLEDPEFNKKYKAYSSDEVEGRYLITPAFMERFKNIQTAFGVRKVKCSFYGDSLLFAISSHKNLFEIGNLFTPLNSPKHIETFFNELISIFAMIEHFKLDEKTGL